MNDPYSVLGVSPSASDAEVKKAYRDLARKYHPDNYHDNPLADLAQEKMKEINEAYDTITKMRAGQSGGYSNYRTGGSQSGYSNYRTGAAGGGYQSGYQSSYQGGSAEFQPVRAALSSGNLALAEQLLNASGNRGAEWNFLMGSLYYRKGWYDEARRYYSTACRMDPSNGEYQQALRMVNTGSPYRPEGYQQSGGLDMCDICSMLMCANLCCRCN